MQKQGSLAHSWCHPDLTLLVLLWWKKGQEIIFFLPHIEDDFQSCQSHVVLLFLSDHVSKKMRGTPVTPFNICFFSLIHKVNIDWGVPGLIVPLLQWLAFSPCVTKLLWPLQRCDEISARSQCLVKYLVLAVMWDGIAQHQSECDCSILCICS